MIIGITGTNGAGKGTVVDYLKTKGFTHYSASGLLAVELEQRGMEKTRPHFRAIGNEFREKFGSGYLVRHFLEEAKKSAAKDIVIESIRTTGEAEELKKAGGVLLIIDAERKVRYGRIMGRKSGKDLIDFDTFVEQEEREWYGAEGKHDMNIHAVMGMADYTIMNEGTLQALHAEIDAVLEQIKNT